MEVKNMNGKLKKSHIGLIMAIALVVSFGAVGTLAYITKTLDTMKNSFNLGETTVIIVEPSVDPSSVPWGANTKPVKLTNQAGPDSVPGFVRALLVPTIVSKENGQQTEAKLGALSEPVSNRMVLGDIELVFVSDWKTNWFYKDGYFYYRNMLNPGESTTNLLSGVVLSSTGKAENFAKVDVKVNVLADIIQYGDAPAAAAWGIHISGTTASP